MSGPLPVIGMPKQSRSRSAASTHRIVPPDHIYEIPAKLIKTPGDMKIWEKSEAYFEYLGFVLAINEAVKGRSNSQGTANVSEDAGKLVGMLDKLDALIDENPPIQQPQRFGNQAFRTWYQAVKNRSMDLVQEVIKPDLYNSLPEILTYLIDSFGNPTRIDYGTGHEMSFIMFLCCLFKIGFLKDADKSSTGCCIFPRYLDLARKLQKTYRMEPAGSHGVWSLDDYQFIPFIWGSSQLVAHPVIEPKSFLEERILNEYGPDYMFLTSIQYINSVKSGPFAEHSNQLWSISGVSSWSKINGGLIKMYRAEVLSKFPVVQHTVFGSLFTLQPMEQGSGMMTPKYSMMPPPVASLQSSHSSNEGTKESSKSSEIIRSEALSSSSSSQSVAQSKGAGPDSEASTPSSRQSSDSVATGKFSASRGARGSDCSEGSQKPEVVGSDDGDKESTAGSVRFGSVDVSDGKGHGRKEARMAL